MSLSLFVESALASPAWEWGAALLGLVVGSFANVCIHRLPLGRSVVTPRSRCPACGAAIRAWENVPLLSYVLLLGRCRSCRAPISLRYPAVEAANGLLYLALAWRMGPTPRTLVTMAFVTALLALSLIDLDHHLLPDAITLPGIAVGLASSFLPGTPDAATPLAALTAAAAGYGALAAVAWTYRKTRGVEGLGQGDWKMVAMLGAFLGWKKMLLTVFLATLSGTLVGVAFMVFRGRSGQYALPLGTFLGLAGIVVVLGGDPILDWYRGFYGG